VVGVIVPFRRFIKSVVGGFFFCFGCLSQEWLVFLFCFGGLSEVWMVFLFRFGGLSGDWLVFCRLIIKTTISIDIFILNPI
jgi:hypothetical protein